MKSNIKREDVLRYISNKFNSNTQDLTFKIGSDTNPLFKPISKESDGNINDYELEFNYDDYKKTIRNHIPVSVLISEGDYASLADLSQNERITSADWSIAVSMYLFFDGQVHDKLLFAVEEARDKFLSKLDFLEARQLDYNNPSAKPVTKYYKVVTRSNDITPSGVITVSGYNYLEYTFSVDLAVVDNLHFANQFEFYLGYEPQKEWDESSLLYWSEFGIEGGAFDLEQLGNEQPDVSAFIDPQQLNIGTAGRIKYGGEGAFGIFGVADEEDYEASDNKKTLNRPYETFQDEAEETFSNQPIGTVIKRTSNEAYDFIQGTQGEFEENVLKWGDGEFTSSPTYKVGKWQSKPNPTVVGETLEVVSQDWDISTEDEANFGFIKPLLSALPKTLNSGVKATVNGLLVIPSEKSVWDSSFNPAWQVSLDPIAFPTYQVLSFESLPTPVLGQTAQVLNDIDWNEIVGTHVAVFGYIKPTVSELPVAFQNGLKAIATGYNLAQSNIEDWNAGSILSWVERVSLSSPYTFDVNSIDELPENAPFTGAKARVRTPDWVLVDTLANVLFSNFWNTTIQSYWNTNGTVGGTYDIDQTPNTSPNPSLLTDPQTLEVGVAGRIKYLDPTPIKTWVGATSSDYNFGIPQISLEKSFESLGDVNEALYSWSLVGTLSSWDYDVSHDYFTSDPLFGFPEANESRLNQTLRLRTFLQDWFEVGENTFESQMSYKWVSSGTLSSPFDTDNISTPPTAIGQKARVFVSETYKWDFVNSYLIGDDPNTTTDFTEESGPATSPNTLFGTPQSAGLTAKNYVFGNFWEETNESAYNSASLKGTISVGESWVIGDAENPDEVELGFVLKVNQQQTMTEGNSTPPSRSATEQDWSTQSEITGADGDSRWTAYEIPATYKWTEVGYDPGSPYQEGISTPPTGLGQKARVLSGTPEDPFYVYYISEVDTPLSYDWAIVPNLTRTVVSYWVVSQSTSQYSYVVYYQSSINVTTYEYYISDYDLDNSNGDILTLSSLSQLPDPHSYLEGYVLKVTVGSTTYFFENQLYLASTQYYQVLQNAFLFSLEQQYPASEQTETAVAKDKDGNFFAKIEVTYNETFAYYKVDTSPDFSVDSDFFQETVSDLPFTTTLDTKAIIINASLVESDEATYNASGNKINVTITNINQKEIMEALFSQEPNIFVSLSSFSGVIKATAPIGDTYWVVSATNDAEVYNLTSIETKYYEGVRTFIDPRFEITIPEQHGSLNMDEVWFAYQEQLILDDIGLLYTDDGMVKANDGIQDFYFTVSLAEAGGVRYLESDITSTFYTVELTSSEPRLSISLLSSNYTHDNIMISLQDQHYDSFVNLATLYAEGLVIRAYTDIDDISTYRYFQLDPVGDLSVVYYISSTSSVFFEAEELLGGDKLTMEIPSIPNVLSPNSRNVMQYFATLHPTYYADLVNFYNTGSMVQVTYNEGITYWKLTPFIELYTKVSDIDYEEFSIAYYVVTQGDEIKYERVLPLISSWGTSNTLSGHQVLRNKALTIEQQKLSKMIHNIVATRGFGVGFTFLFEEKDVIKQLFKQTYIMGSTLNVIFYVRMKFLNEFRDVENKPYFDYDETVGFDYPCVIGEVSTSDLSYGDNVIFTVGFAPSWVGVNNGS